MNAPQSQSALRHLNPPWELDDAGEGPALVLLHGGAGPESLRSTAKRLSAHQRVLTPTHPGWGAAERPEELDGVPALAQAYLAMIDSLGIAPVVVIGSSFGGWVAAEMAVQDDQGRIDGLVLIDAIGPAISRPPQATVQPPSTPEPDRPNPMQRSLDIIRSYAGERMSDGALLAKVERVRIPVLVVWGSDDPVVPVAYGRDYAAAFPASTFEVIPQAGHMPVLDNPADTFALVERFVADVQGARA